MAFSLWQKQVGPFMGVSEDRTVTVGGTEFRIVLYGAYNAYGLIGSEQNGIAILDNDKRAVLLDMECCEGTGYFGPSKRQQRRLQEILEMAEKDPGKWKQFINTHPRARYSV